MAIIITLQQKGARVDTVKEIVTKALQEKYPDINIQIIKKERAESRADRFEEAKGLVSDALMEMESLRDELQEWHDNLPENLQDSQKANDLKDAIIGLDDIVNNLEEADQAEIEFPGAF